MVPRPLALLLAVMPACSSRPPAAVPTTPPPSAAVTEPIGSAPPPVAPSAPARPAPGTKQYDAATLFKNIGVIAAGFSRDGSRALVAMNSSGVYNLYAIPTAGGEPVRLTTSTESQYAVRYFPADDRVLYTQDRGGNELNHLYVLDGQEVRDLTPGDKTKATFLRFSRDGAWFWVTTNERDPKLFDVYRYAAKDYQRELVFTNKGSWAVGDVSRDGRWLALGKPRTNADSDIFLVDLNKPKAAPKVITAHKGDIQNNVYGFAPSSKVLWYGTDGQGEFTQAWSYDLAAGKARAEITSSWDVAFVGFSENGRYRVSATNEDAKTVLRVFDTTTSKDVALPELPNGDVTGTARQADPNGGRERFVARFGRRSRRQCQVQQ